MTSAASSPSRPTHEVSRFEYTLLRLLRFFMGRLPTDQGLALVRAGSTPPACLSGTAVRLVEETLAKGCVLFLTQSGGWRNDRYLRGGRLQGGRVWERNPLEERTLAFSPVVLDFLIWATAEKLPEPKTKWNPSAVSLTAADELYFFLAFDACRADPLIIDSLRRRDVFDTNPLIWLTGPADIAQLDEPRPPDFDRLFTGERVAILESLQPILLQRWLRMERMKGKIADWKQMRFRGRSESAALQAFLSAADRANRRDLARFLLKANSALFVKDRPPTYWTGGLAGQGPPRLADRLEIQRVALAVPQQMAVMAEWTEQARNVSYFDEGYAASQSWKADWEAANGDVVTQRARATIEALDPLRSSQ